MASLVKRCRHPRGEWDGCGCAWYVRRRVAGRDTYTNVGSDPVAARAALEGGARRADVPLVDLLAEWLALQASRPGARPNSLAVYRSRARHVRAWFGGVPARSVRPDHLTRMVDALLAAGYAPATVQGVYSLTTAVLRHGVRTGALRAVPVPFDGPGIPTPRPRAHALTLEQVEQVIGRLAAPWRQVAELVLLTGLRWGEAVAIEPGDVDGAVLRVRRTANRYAGTNDPKTRAGQRVVPLTPRARVILAELALPVGGDYRRAREALVHAMGALHQPGMGWHTIRNAHASLLDAAGVSLRDAAARMGHGAHYAQTLAYGLAVEAGHDGGLDAVRRRAGAAGGLGRVVPLRARRRGRG